MDAPLGDARKAHKHKSEKNHTYISLKSKTRYIYTDTPRRHWAFRASALSGFRQNLDTWRKTWTLTWQAMRQTQKYPWR